MQLLGVRERRDREDLGPSSPARSRSTTWASSADGCCRAARRASTATIGIASCHLSRIERVGRERERGQEHRRDDVDVPAVARAFGPGAVREERAARPAPNAATPVTTRNTRPPASSASGTASFPYGGAPAPPAEQHEEPADQHERRARSRCRARARAGRMRPRTPMPTNRSTCAGDWLRYLPASWPVGRELRPEQVAATASGTVWNSATRQPAEPAPEQHREADDRDHRDRDARAHQAGEPGEQPEPVAPVDRTVVVGEQQLREPEHERAHERDLERDEDVLARPHRRTRTPRPRSSRSTGRTPGAPHHDEQQRRAATRCSTTTSAWYGQ